jgi:hypothetical protein
MTEEKKIDLRLIRKASYKLGIGANLSADEVAEVARLADATSGDYIDAGAFTAADGDPALDRALAEETIESLKTLLGSNGRPILAVVSELLASVGVLRSQCTKLEAQVASERRGVMAADEVIAGQGRTINDRDAQVADLSNENKRLHALVSQLNSDHHALIARAEAAEERANREHEWATNAMAEVQKKEKAAEAKAGQIEDAQFRWVREVANRIGLREPIGSVAKVKKEALDAVETLYKSKGEMADAFEAFVNEVYAATGGEGEWPHDRSLLVHRVKLLSDDARWCTGPDGRNLREIAERMERSLGPNLKAWLMSVPEDVVSVFDWTPADADALLQENAKLEQAASMAEESEGYEQPEDVGLVLVTQWQERAASMEAERDRAQATLYRVRCAFEGNRDALKRIDQEIEG